MSRVVLKRGNDQVVSLTGLHNTKTKEFLNAATVKATLRDSKGNAVLPFENVAMVYVPGSQGNYEWIVEGEQMMLPKGIEYSVVFTAEQAGLNYRTVHVATVTDGEC